MNGWLPVLAALLPGMSSWYQLKYKAGQRDRADTLEKRKICYCCSKLKPSVSVVQSVALSLYQLNYLTSHLVYIGLKSGLCVLHILFNRFY